MIRCHIELAASAAKNFLQIAGELVEAKRQLQIDQANHRAGTVPESFVLSAEECVASYEDALRRSRDELAFFLEKL